MRHWKSIGSELFVVGTFVACGLGFAAIDRGCGRVLYPDPNSTSATSVPQVPPQHIPARAHAIYRRAGRLPAVDRPAFIDRAVADPSLTADEIDLIRKAEATWLLRAPQVKTNETN